MITKINIDDQKLKKILLDGNYVTAEDIKLAEKFAKDNNASIVEYLTARDCINKSLLGQAIAESYGTSYADLDAFEPSRDQVLIIPEVVAKKFGAVVFSEDEKEIVVATQDPSQQDLLIELKKDFPQKNAKLAFAFLESIEPFFMHYRKPLKTRFSEIIEKQKRVAPEIIEEIFEDALDFQSSDVHFEPQEKEVVVRFRVDGVLQEAGRIPKEHYENILNRIKVQGHMRLDEHFAAQDGSIRYTRKGKTINMRISIVPTLDGEKIVIRILGEYVKSFSLSDIGLSPLDQKTMKEEAEKPFGMILVVGPTGSGKTTTLYAILKLLNKPDVNITTIEDPVEYKTPGINQIQVNVKTNLTFAKGLRSIVRQDPDIILVGEIRDEETAEIAVNAALTGHLMLSTFHANDAATTIPRLLDMGIEPFLLASTLDVIVAQRLVRRICEKCRMSTTFSMEELKDKMPEEVSRCFPEKDISLYRGKGCESCNNTGYKGRVAIFEVIKNTPELQNLILTNPSTQQVWKLARSQGARSLFEDGIEKVKSGVTTIKELLRAANPTE